jgi:pimeloyl-ACP methyl ester carboxylesterase
VDKPVLVVNGDDDTMLPTVSSFHLAQLLPDVQLSVYPDSGHGGIFQHHDVFVAQHWTSSATDGTRQRGVSKAPRH